MYNQRMNTRAASICAALLALAAGCSTTPQTSAEALPPDGVEFRLDLKEGETYPYSLSISVDGTMAEAQPAGTNISMKIDMRQTLKVAKVEDGKMTIAIANSDIKASGQMADSIEKALSSMTSKIVIDKSGRVLSQEGPVDTNAGVAGLIYFPDKKVKPGATWEKTTPGPNGNAIIAKYKFEAVHELDGKTVARISMTPISTNKNLTVGGRYDYFVDIHTSLVVKADGKMSTSYGGQTMKTQMMMSKE